MNILDKITEDLHESLTWPFCESCYMSRVRGGGVCGHCHMAKQKKADSLAAFLERKRTESPAYQPDVEPYTGRLF